MIRLKRAIARLLRWASLPLAGLLAFTIRYVDDPEPLFRIFQRRGFLLLREHYYLPIPDADDMSRARRSELVGLAMNDASQLRFTEDVILRYRPEFLAFPENRSDDPHQFHLVNGTFMSGDGDAYYALVRHLKPAAIIEIGSGNSTLLASHAIRQNAAEVPGYACRLTAIEPFPGEGLATLPGLHELRRCKVQDVELEVFDQLGPGDILFIDSSHVLKTGGDVWLEYCEIIPRLKAGVHVHVHDISLPAPYPNVYFDSHLYWNEQYLLQALLTNNDRLEVVWAGSYLFDKYGPLMSMAFAPGFQRMRQVYPLAVPSSFWMRVRG